MTHYKDKWQQINRSDDTGTANMVWIWFLVHATIPLGRNFGQVVYSHYLPSFSAPRNWGTKNSFRRL